MRYALPVGLILLICGNARAQEKSGIDFFEKHIRPVLVAKCHKCHSADSKEVKGNLLLDTRKGIRAGGDSGKAVVPGNTEDSILLEAIRWEGLEMPPDEQLPADVIALFEKWVKIGAPDPRDGDTTGIRRTIDFETAREFWAFRPIEQPALAERLLADPGLDDSRRIDLAYRLTLCRLPSDTECGNALSFVEETATSLSGGAEHTPQATIKAWSGLTQALLGSAEFRYVE
jgi:hypothetical protein